MKSLLILGIFTFNVFSSTEVEWQRQSNPKIMDSEFNHQLDQLPISGVIEEKSKFWSGDYWGDLQGGINKRWYGQNKKSPPTQNEIKQLSIPEIATYSAAEKWDLYQGHYDYPFRNAVLNRLVSHPKSWEGICHGWAPASMNHNEPTPKYLNNPQGVQIPFGSSDIKALISWYYAHLDQGPTFQMGKRCYQSDPKNTCIEDMNAGAFHIVLTNMVALWGEGFIVDIEDGEQVWNHPVYSFQARIIRTLPPLPDSATGTLKSFLVETNVQFINESQNDWQTVLQTNKQKFIERVYRYTLDVNSLGKIIGGKWDSSERPDFIWKKNQVRYFKGELTGLEVLLND
ncbi:MAG: hypothetical protein AB7I27_13600 [Bacteriovoracaceae bacterium]